MKKRYYTFSNYLKEKYNSKVYKISIDGGFSCPGICSYCSSNGSLAPYARKNIEYFENITNNNYINNNNYNLKNQNFNKQRFKSIDERKNYIKKQIESSLEYYKNKNIQNLYIYFQAFSNLYDTEENIYEIYKYTLSLYNFKGLIIGTRPDTVNENKIIILKNIFKELNIENIDFWIEIGLQTSNDNTLKIINRNHKSKDFEDCIKTIRKFDNVKIGTHIILGLPFETKEDNINTIKFLNKNNIDGIKFHYLYIIENTQIYYYYLEKKFKILSFEEYIDYLSTCIGYLNKNIVIFRLFSDPEPGEYLPKYGIPKNKAIQILDEYLGKNDIFQGKFT